MTTGYQDGGAVTAAYSLWDEIPSMTIDGREADVTNAIVTCGFKCAYCREVNRVASFRGTVTIGLRGSGKSARWYQQEKPGPKPTPGACPACGEARAYKGYTDREPAACTGGQKTLELLNHAWKHFRAILPEAEVAAADRKRGT